MANTNDQTRLMQPQQAVPKPEKAEPAPASTFASTPTDDLEIEGPPSLLEEFKWFLTENKKWWLLPLILVFVGMAGLLFLGGGSLAPFIYTLF